MLPYAPPIPDAIPDSRRHPRFQTPSPIPDAIPDSKHHHRFQMPPPIPDNSTDSIQFHTPSILDALQSRHLSRFHGLLACRSASQMLGEEHFSVPSFPSGSFFCSFLSGTLPRTTAPSSLIASPLLMPEDFANGLRRITSCKNSPFSQQPSSLFSWCSHWENGLPHIFQYRPPGKRFSP